MNCDYRRSVADSMSCDHEAICLIPAKYFAKTYLDFSKAQKWILTVLGATLGVVGRGIFRTSQHVSAVNDKFLETVMNLEFVFYLAASIYFLIWLATIFLMGNAKANSVKSQFWQSVAYPIALIETLGLLIEIAPNM